MAGTTRSRGRWAGRGPRTGFARVKGRTVVLSGAASASHFILGSRWSRVPRVAFSSWSSSSRPAFSRSAETIALHFGDQQLQMRDHRLRAGGTGFPLRDAPCCSAGEGRREVLRYRREFGSGTGNDSTTIASRWVQEIRLIHDEFSPPLPAAMYEVDFSNPSPPACSRVEAAVMATMPSDGRGPDEPAAFQSPSRRATCQAHHAKRIFNRSPRFAAGKRKDRRRAGRARNPLLDLQRQPIHAAAHIGHTDRQPDMNPGWRRDHPRSAASTRRNVARPTFCPGAKPWCHPASMISI